MSKEQTCYAAMILPDASALGADPYILAACDAITRCDTTPDTPPAIDLDRATVSGDTLRLTIEPQEDSDFGPRILITARATPNARFSEERAARVLSDTVLGALDFSDADIIEWFSPDTLLDTEDFIRLRSYVSPRRSSAHPADFDDDPLDIEDQIPLDQEDASSRRAEKSLAAMFREPLPNGIQLEQQSQLTERLLNQCAAMRDTESADPRFTAAGWAMAGTAAVMSRPVGASMSVVGLARGLDFRRVSQVLSITSLFVVMQNQGLLQQLTKVLP